MDVSNTSEQHPYFPSGPWEGFYLYGGGSAAHRHPMRFSLDFRDGEVTGAGSDDIGAFSWRGNYDATTMAVTLVKRYRTHEVFYRGMADESGIYGGWQLHGMRGGFHIWPRQNGESEEATEAEIEEKVLTLNNGVFT